MKVRTLVSVGFLLVIAFGALLSIGAAQTGKPDAPLPWDWTLGSLREYATITVGDDVLVVEIADDGLLRQRGLSYRDGLEPGTGMLFIYPDVGDRSFWMKEMRFCLDIIWLSDTEVVGAAEDACPEPGVPDNQLARYVSNEPVRFILEVPANWLAERGYGPGTPIDLTGFPSDSGS
ncbi:MAG: DUF192 domain-containing protein [Thermomicrobiales bacterium]|nr:DUF192 domain-containing protein [Thermomicrobiales bacterium]